MEIRDRIGECHSSLPAWSSASALTRYLASISSKMPIWNLASASFIFDGVQEIASNSRGWLRVPNAAIKAIAGYQNAVEPEKQSVPKAKFSPGDEATSSRARSWHSRRRSSKRSGFTVQKC
jgi:hypothetical protein